MTISLPTAGQKSNLYLYIFMTEKYLIFNPQERYRNFFQCCLFTILLTARLRLDSNWKTGLKQEDSLNVYFSFYSNQQHDFNMITSDLLEQQLLSKCSWLVFDTIGEKLATKHKACLVLANFNLGLLFSFLFSVLVEKNFQLGNIPGLLEISSRLEWSRIRF